MNDIGWIIVVSMLAIFSVIFLLMSIDERKYRELYEKDKSNVVDYEGYKGKYLGKEISINEARDGVDHNEIGMLFSMAGELGFNTFLGSSSIENIMRYPSCVGATYSYGREADIIIASYAGKFGPDKKITYIDHIK
jgi:hypothetical protein